MDLSKINQKIKNLQMQAQEYQLIEAKIKSNPFDQFLDWFEEILQSETCNPTAMALATIDENHYPDIRVVLLKQLENNQFIFYSSYDSKKAKQLIKNNIAAINFYWPHYSRQVRIKGRVEKIDRSKSEAYFSTRPRKTQLGAHAWIQSSILSSRNEMEDMLKLATEKFTNKEEIPCPNNWGGYALTPFEYEFFQGRDWRMHDRLLYTFHDNGWKIVRLAP